jgi:Fic family protein
LKTLDNPDSAGKLQGTDEERVHVEDSKTNEILHRPPPAEELPARLALMCDFANGEDGEKGFIHPVIRAIILHFWLAYDHPFVDGNGRTARALFYWSMLSQGYWLFEFVSISRILKEAPSKYGKAYLYTETDDNDLTYYIIYQLEVIIRAISELDVYFERKIKEVQEVENQLKNSSQFNYRQLGLLSHATKHPGAEYTIRSHQESNNVAYATSRADLLDLEAKGLLQLYRQGKKQIFKAPSDISIRLKQAS